jgi:hypothetical protein
MIKKEVVLKGLRKATETLNHDSRCFEVSTSRTEVRSVCRFDLYPGIKGGTSASKVLAEMYSRLGAVLRSVL